MHAGRMTLRGADRLEAEWAVYDKGKQAGANKFFLERVKAALSAPWAGSVRQRCPKSSVGAGRRSRRRAGSRPRARAG